MATKEPRPIKLMDYMGILAHRFPLGRRFGSTEAGAALFPHMKPNSAQATASPLLHELSDFMKSCPEGVQLVRADHRGWKFVQPTDC